MSGFTQQLILFELIGIHVRHHANVEPTFLIVDGWLGFHHPRAQIEALERLQLVTESAQVAIVSSNPFIAEELSSEWQQTSLEDWQPGSINRVDCPIDFEVETSIAPPSVPPAGSPAPG